MKKLLALMLLTMLILNLSACVPSSTNTFDPNFVYLPTYVKVETSTGYTTSMRYTYGDNYHLKTLTYGNYFGEYNFPVTTDSDGHVLSYKGSFQASDDLIDYMSFDYTYAEDGKLLSITTDAGVWTEQIKERTYDSNGLLKRIKIFQPNHKRTTYIECEHDENGNIISVRKYQEQVSEDQLYSFVEISYNENGQRIQELRHDGNGTCTDSVHYTYEDTKTIAYVQFFNKDGTVFETTTYTFDYCGNLVEAHTRSDDSEHTTTYRYEYKKVPLASAPQNIYVYHKTLPELGLFD